MNDLEQKLTTQVRTMQIIVVAMVVVPLIFAGVVLVIGAQTPEEPAPINGQVAPAAQGQLVVERMAMAAGLAAIFLQQVMGRHVRGQAVQNLIRQVMAEPARLGEAYLTGLVVSGAINEMAAFLNLIAYMNSQSPFNFGMAMLLIASTATKFPTCKRVAKWARAKAQELAGAAEG